ncbi:haloacid dehalogenase type II [Piscinibacter sakaiensis]|uniref:haloacid dehalogenase type II n=1 Tax=Piscinibacter sakaiensis TaxID=1547922 RepID=UPI003728CE0F
MRALVFDVFGTLVDWRGSIARETEALLHPLGLAVDGLRFADDWRARYQPAMQQVRSGRLPFSRLDVLHRMNLDQVLAAHGLDARVDEATRVALNLAWHRLDAWPDVAPGLRRLRERFLLAPCSNGNISLMVDLARRNGLPWDAILGAELARDYKPKPAVYLAAAAAFDLAPAEVMMVAAHGDDLVAARGAGAAAARGAAPGRAGRSSAARSPRPARAG